MADEKRNSADEKRSQADQEGAERTDVMTADVGAPYPDTIRDLAADLPEKDPVQKAYKQQMLADSTQAEARAKAKIVDESPDSDETPSGSALKKVAGIAHDAKRGEAYAREKSAVRWGYVPVDES